MNGPYAFYVWTAFGLSGLVVAWMTIDTLLRSRRWRRRAEDKGKS